MKEADKGLSRCWKASQASRPTPHKPQPRERSHVQPRKPLLTTARRARTANIGANTTGCERRTQSLEDAR